MNKKPDQMLQEIYQDNPWRLLVCCILINQTTRAQVDKVRETLFRRYPDAIELARADEQELIEIIRPCGFYNRRAKSLKQFSEDWISEDWTDVKELYGIGKYAQESYRIFVLGEHIENPEDKELLKYVRRK